MKLVLRTGFLLVLAAAMLAGEKPESVLFVCEHGAAKSVLAAAEFNRLAAERGLSVRAKFRGTSPSADISPAVSSALAREGVSVNEKPPGCRVTRRNRRAAQGQAEAKAEAKAEAMMPSA